MVKEVKAQLTGKHLKGQTKTGIKYICHGLCILLCSVLSRFNEKLDLVKVLVYTADTSVWLIGCRYVIAMLSISIVITPTQYL